MRNIWASREAAARAGVFVALVAATAGCASGAARVKRMGQIPTPKDTAMSAEVRAASERPTVYPKFSDIPPTPDDVRPMAGWDRAVLGLKQDGVQLRAEIAAAPPPPTDTAAFAAEGVAEARPPPSPDAPADTEAFAAKARDAAKPPPVPK